MGELPEAALSVARGFELGSPPSFATTGFAASAKAFAAGTALATSLGAATPLGASSATTGVSLAAEANLPFAVVSIVAAICAAPSFAAGVVPAAVFDESGATGATGAVASAVAAIPAAA